MATAAGLAAESSAPPTSQLSSVPTPQPVSPVEVLGVVLLVLLKPSDLPPLLADGARVLIDLLLVLVDLTVKAR